MKIGEKIGEKILNFVLSVFILLAISYQGCSMDSDMQSSVTKVSSPSSESNESEEIVDSDEKNIEEVEKVEENEEIEEVIDREWTVLVYMAADNNLEASAIDDLNELESATIPENMTVLVLLDRANGYDASNGNWTDTRLFRVKHGVTNQIESEQLDCPELGLKTDSCVELDMANKSTLSGFLKYAVNNFSAEKYALIVWGHGTGWRSSDSLVDSVTGASGIEKAFAVDSYSDSYMTLSAFREAVLNGMKNSESKKLDFLGFDTCFGVCLESAYEFSSIADVMAGSPNVEGDGGWDYEALFNFVNESENENLSSEDFALICEKQFKNQYSGYSGSTFCSLKLSEISNLVEQFDSFCEKVADTVRDFGARNAVADVFQNKAIAYKASGYPCDFYVDSQNVVELLSSVSGVSCDEVLKSFDEAILSSWSTVETKKICSPAVFYTIFVNSGVVSSTHSENYIYGNSVLGKSKFVEKAKHYVPTKSNSGSLLDKIFYTTYQN